MAEGLLGLRRMEFGIWRCQTCRTTRWTSLIDADDYLIYRYIELNPVRAGMVAAPEEYPWSSYLCHAWGDADALVTDHLHYMALEEAPAQRQKRYRQLFEGRMPEDALTMMREALSANCPLGNDRFRDSIMRQLGRPLGKPRRGSAGKRGGGLLTPTPFSLGAEVEDFDYGRAALGRAVIHGDPASIW